MHILKNIIIYEYAVFVLVRGLAVFQEGALLAHLPGIDIVLQDTKWRRVPSKGILRIRVGTEAVVIRRCVIGKSVRRENSHSRHPIKDEIIPKMIV
jgi:hypothetical protein